jgi:hypothetical protein
MVAARYDTGCYRDWRDHPRRSTRFGDRHNVPVIEDATRDVRFGTSMHSVYRL